MAIIKHSAQRASHANAEIRNILVHCLQATIVYLRVQLLFYREKMHINNLHLVNNITKGLNRKVNPLELLLII